MGALSDFWEEIKAGGKDLLGGIQGEVTFGGGAPTEGSVTIGERPTSKYLLIGVAAVVVLLLLRKG